MESVTDNPHLIVIVGQTASGKSSLAMDLAQRFNGEIITADSRTVYKGMDIGTAKPTVQDQKLVRHHLVDIVTPDQAFTVADFQKRAQAAITDVVSRGKTPFLVGGSGLYVDAVLYNFSFRPSADPERRRFLETLSIRELQGLLKQKGLALPENSSNPRHLIRAIESEGAVPQRTGLRPNSLVLGLIRERDDLAKLAQDRVERMFRQGFVEETRRLASKYGWQTPALQAPGYRAVRMYLAGQTTQEQAKQRCVQEHLQYAKRQKTWFKRNRDIHWISNSAEGVDLVTTFLNK